MSMKEHLESKTVSELVASARQLGIRGYSSLKKNGLIELLKTNITNPEVTGHAIEFLTKSGQLMLSQVVNAKGTIDYNELKNEFIKQKSKTTFYKALNDLTTSLLCHEEDLEEQYQVKIFDESLPVIQKILQEKYPDLGIKDEEPEKEEEETTTTKLETVDDIFNIMASKTDMQSLLQDAKMKKSGNKPVVVDRLLYESSYTVETLLNLLLTKAMLADISREKGLKVSGTKPELVSRIVESISLQKPTPKAERAAGVAQLATMAKPSAQEVVKPVTMPKKKRKLKTRVFELLEDLQIDYHGISKENELDCSVATYLMTVLHGKPDYTLERKKKPDIIISRGSERIAIECKYVDQVHPNTTINKAKSEAFDYSHEFPDGVIFVFYDKDGKMSAEDEKRFKSSFKLIYQTMEDYTSRL